MWVEGVEGQGRCSLGSPVTAPESQRSLWGGGSSRSSFLRWTRLWGRGRHTSSWTCRTDGWLLENQFSEASQWGGQAGLGELQGRMGRGSVPSQRRAAPQLCRPCHLTLPLQQAVPQAWRPSLAPSWAPGKDRGPSPGAGVKAPSPHPVSNWLCELSGPQFPYL